MSKTKRVDNIIKTTAKYHCDEDLAAMYKKVRAWAKEKGYHMNLVFRMMFESFLEEYGEKNESDN